MNKLFIGLLIIAAGAGAFFLFSKKKNQTAVAVINKELIIGKWNPTFDQPLKDSPQPIYEYQFLKDGNILQAANDSVKADTAHYEWNKSNELVWKEKSTDSTGKTYLVVQLTTDSLRIQAKDSSILLFTKAK